MEMECILVLTAHTEHRIYVTGCFMSNIYTRVTNATALLLCGAVWVRSSFRSSSDSCGILRRDSTVAFRLIAARPNCSSIADFGAT